MKVDWNLVFTIIGFLSTVSAFTVHALFGVAKAAKELGARMTELNNTLAKLTEEQVELRSSLRQIRKVVNSIQYYLAKTTSYEIRSGDDE